MQTTEVKQLERDLKVVALQAKKYPQTTATVRATSQPRWRSRRKTSGASLKSRQILTHHIWIRQGKIKDTLAKEGLKVLPCPLPYCGGKDAKGDAEESNGNAEELDDNQRRKRGRTAVFDE